MIYMATYISESSMASVKRRSKAGFRTGMADDDPEIQHKLLGSSTSYWLIEVMCLQMQALAVHGWPQSPLPSTSSAPAG